MADIKNKTRMPKAIPNMGSNRTEIMTMLLTGPNETNSVHYELRVGVAKAVFDGVTDEPSSY